MDTQKKSGYGMLYAFTKDYKGHIVVAGVMTLLSVAFNFLTPQVMRFITDNVIGDKPITMPQIVSDAVTLIGGMDFLRQNLMIVAALTIIFAVASGIFNYYCRVSMAKASEGAIRDMRDYLFDHIQKLPFSWHVKHQTGDIIQRCTSDVEVIRGFISMQVLEFFRISVLIIIALVLMFSMNVKLSLIALAFIPIVVIYSGGFYTMISRKFKAADEAEGDLSATVQENLTGVRVVRAFGREAFEVDKFNKKNDRFAFLWTKLGYLMGAYWGIGDFATGLQLMIITALGAVECVNGSLTLGQYLVFISYNGMLVWPIRGFGRILSEMSKTGVSLNRVKEILDERQEKNTENSQKYDVDGDIEFKNVSFRYNKGEHFSEESGKASTEDSKEVLENVSFTVKKGTTVGILGGTGSGKSTLMYLLDRLYTLPDGCGEILINGHNIQDFDLEHLRKNIGLVLQEPFLFSKTIRENIAVTLQEQDEALILEQVRNASKDAVVDDSIMGFELKYDTVVGERGVTLSGGQKQRVSIARMLMQKTPIMIFDDSLSAVDSETDAKIRKAIQNNSKDRTVIIISHRITTIMNADNIVILDDGKISQMGTHHELVSQEGIYKTIYDIQGSLESELHQNDTTVGGGN